MRRRAGKGGSGGEAEQSGAGACRGSAAAPDRHFAEHILFPDCFGGAGLSPSPFSSSSPPPPSHTHTNPSDCSYHLLRELPTTTAIQSAAAGCRGLAEGVCVSLSLPLFHTRGVRCSFPRFFGGATERGGQGVSRSPGLPAVEGAALALARAGTERCGEEDFFFSFLPPPPFAG